MSLELSSAKKTAICFHTGTTQISPVAIKIVDTTGYLSVFLLRPKIDGDVVFVGYGISASELNDNDYAKPNATGKIAIALQGTPDGANPHGQVRAIEGVRWKAVAARNAGAKGLIVIAGEPNLKTIG